MQLRQLRTQAAVSPTAVGHEQRTLEERSVNGGSRIQCRPGLYLDLATGHTMFVMFSRAGLSHGGLFDPPPESQLDFQS